jgi:hypothetical protein
MTIMNTASFQTLVDRRYREIKDFEMASVTDQLPMWFDMDTSDSFEERRGTIGELPIWDTFQGNLTYARFYEQYNAVATHIVFTQALRWDRTMMDDDLTGIMRGDRYRKMVRSGIISRQMHGARLWNFAASNDSYFYSRSEGVPLASAAHTTRADGVSTATGFNNITVAELAPTSYRAARQQMRRFANDRGYIINVIPDCLVVPIELEQRAMEIQDSPGDADTARRSSNPEAGTAGIEVPLYWTSTTNWALCNKALMKENIVWFDHTKPDFKSVIDFETFQLKASGYMRYSWLALDWRWLMFANVG